MAKSTTWLHLAAKEVFIVIACPAILCYCRRRKISSRFHREVRGRQGESQSRQPGPLLGPWATGLTALPSPCNQGSIQKPPPPGRLLGLITPIAGQLANLMSGPLFLLSGAFGYFGTWALPRIPERLCFLSQGLHFVFNMYPIHHLQPQIRTLRQ